MKKKSDSSNVSLALIGSIFSLLIMLIFSFTPVAWIISGRNSESYPELAFLFYGIPTALLMLVSSIILKVFEKRNLKLGLESRSSILWASFAFTTMLGALLFVVLFSPRGIFSQQFSQFVLDYYLISVIPLDCVLIFIGSLFARQQKN